jgi:hypothetical protein
LIQVVPEESRVRKYCIVCKGLYTCARLEAGARFIECNVAIGSNTAQEKLNTTGLQDLLLVIMTFELQIRRITVEDIDVVWFYVDMGEEMLVHEAVVALWVIAWDPYVLVLLRSASRIAMLLRYTRRQGCSIMLTMLKVTTWRKEISPALWRWTSC